MPRVIAELNESYMGISRPIAIEVLRHVMNVTGVNSETKVMYQGVIQTAALEGSTLEGGLNPTRFSQTERIFITVNEEYVEDDLLTMQVHRPEAPPVFFDEALNIDFSPVYTKVQQTISITFRANDRPSVERWRNGLRRRIAEERTAYYHEVGYTYIIPRPLLGLLSTIHKLRESNAGYGETIKQWFKRCWSPKATTLKNMAGNQPELAIKEVQSGVLGYFDFTNPPAHEKHEDGSLWECTVDYLVFFDKPTSIIAKYPLLVHQKLLPAKFFNRELPYSLDNPRNFPGRSRAAYDAIVRQTQPKRKPLLDGVAYPKFDDWIPHSAQLATSSVVRLLLMVDATDLRDVANLGALGPYSVEENVLAFMLEHRKYVFDNTESPFIIDVYEDQKLIGDALSLDELGNVRTNYDMDLRKTYHLRYSVLNDLTLLSEGAVLRLRTNGKVCIQLLLGLCPELPELGLLPKLTGNGMVSEPDFWAAVQHIRTTNSTHTSGLKEVVRVSVISFAVVAHSNRGI